MSLNKTVQFADRFVGDGHQCFVTFEAGPTHDGLKSAKRLATHAVAAGADAVKFQLVDPERLVADQKLPFSYDVLVDREANRVEKRTEPLYEILKRRTLGKHEWRELKRHCDSERIAFFATALFEDELDFLAELGCASVKIASADVNHFPLIRYAARSSMCVQLDTGSASLGEIESAIDVYVQAGGKDVILHHCPSGYPARLESIHLRMISTLKRMFPCPIAFSDHSPGWDMDIAAVALGADLVEKTITEDRTTDSIEHIMSIEPSEMKSFVKTIRDLEVALGTPRRVFTDTERVRRELVRRSAYLIADARKGESIDSLKVEFRRPGGGIAPDLFERLSGLRLARDLGAGHRLEFSDLS